MRAADPPPANGGPVVPAAPPEGQAAQRWGGAALAAAVALPLAVFGTTAFLAWKETWRAAEADLRHTTEAVAEHAQRVLSAHAVAAGRVDAVLRGLSDAEIRAREAELHAELRALVAEVPQAEGAFVIDRDGYPLVSANVFPVPGGSRVAADRDFFLALRSPDAPAVHLSRVYTGRLDSSLFFAVSRRRTRTGNADAPADGFDGLVNLSVYPNRLAETLRQFAFREGDSLALIRADGEVLARGAGQTAPSRVPANSRFAQLAAAGVGQAAYEGISSLDGVPYLFALRRVPGWPVYASAGRPRAEVIAAWRDAVRGQLAIGVPATLVLLLLALRVRRAQARLEAANAGLEARVTERTAALAESEQRLRRVLDNLFAFVGVLTPEGVLVDANAAPLRAAGLTPDDVRGRLFWDCHWWSHDPELQAWLREACARAAAGGVTRRDVSVRMAGDSRMTIDFQIAPLRDAAGRITHLIPSAVDVTERTEARAALAEREALLSAVGLSSPDLIFAKDAEGRYVYANPPTLAVFGRPAEGVLGRADADLIADPEAAARLAENDRRVLARGEAEVVEEPVRHAGRGGEVRTFLVTKAPMRDGLGRPMGLVGVARDVTEERAAQRALAAAKARLEVVLEGAGLGSWHWHVPSGRVEFDARWAAMLGLGPAEVKPELGSWKRLLHPGDRERVLAAVADHLEGRTPHYETEHRLRHRDGRWIWVLDRGRVVERAADGSPLVATGTHLDITARREAETALAASEERLALAADAARMGVWDWEEDSPGAVVNAEYLALYGLPADHGPVPFEAWAERLHPEDRERALAAARAALEAPSGEYRDEYRARRADTGEERWIAARGRRVDTGGRRRFVGVNYDVTERRAEEERQALLAREVDHRAKNVLAVVRSIVKLTRADDPKRFAEAVEGRVAALARAHNLLARDRWTGAALDEIAREEFAAYGGFARADLAGPPVRLRPDAVQPLSVVLHELATNAAKHGALSVPGGRVALRWTLEPGGEGGGGDPGETLRLRWAERGGPPVPAPPGRRGFGSTVLEATVGGQLDGEVRFDWAPEGLLCELAIPAGRVVAGRGRGALPAPASPSGRPDEAERADGAPLTGCRILLVEDEPLLALEETATLAELGCLVVGPATGLEEALRVAAAEADGLDAAVLDVNLGGRDSFPVADLLARRGVPVVYVSGYGDLPDGRGTGGAAGQLLRKPIRDGALEEALRRALRARSAGAVASDAAL